MNNKLYLAFALVFLISFASAIELIYEQDSIINFKLPCKNNGTYCSGVAECNLTVYGTESEILMDNEAMTNNGAYHSISLNTTLTSESGVHPFTQVCCDNGVCGAWDSYYTVTANGQEKPSDVLSVFFMVMFVVILLWMVYSMFLIIREMVSFDVDLFDTLVPMLSYFVLFAYYSFALDFFGNKMVYTFAEQLIRWGAYTHVYFPILTLLISMIVNGIKLRNDKQANG